MSLRIDTWRFVAAVCAFAFIIQLTTMPNAQASETNSQLEQLTRQIAQKEAQLLRLNTHFRIECTKVSKWKPWRLFVYNAAASGVANAGITSIAATRWHYWTHPAAMKRQTAKTGPTLLLISHCITLGGVVAETALDLINDHKVRKKGFDIKTTHKCALEIKSDLDKLLAERQALLDQPNNGLTEAEAELARAEGIVLKDVRDLALNEYAQFYVRAKRFFANRTTNTVMSTVAASTGGFQGSLLGIISAVKRKPRLVGTGGVGFIISGAAIMATPPVTRLVSSLRGSAARKEIAQEFDNVSVKSVSKLNDDRTNLGSAVQRVTADSQYAANVAKRLTAYAHQSELFGAQATLSAKEKALADKEFKERLFFATAIGGSKMSWGINLANAGYHFHPRYSYIPKTATTKARIVTAAGPAKTFTHRVAIGATTYIPGTGMWILDTLQNRIRGEVRNHKLANQKSLPSDLLKERLDRVEQIEEVFNY